MISKNMIIINSHSAYFKWTLVKGDVLFVRSSVKAINVGLTKVVESNLNKIVFSGFIIRYRDQDYLDNNFKKHCFDQDYFRYRLLCKSTISANTNINQVALRSMQLVVPTKVEQQKIAKFLNTWDKAIKTLNNLIDEKELQKKGVMQQLLTGKKRLQGYKKIKTIEKLKPFIKEYSERNNEGKVNRVLSVTNKKGFINQSEQFERVVASKDLSNYKIVRKGQFAYNPSRVNVGSLDLLKNFEEGLLSPMYIIFETKKDNLLPDFLYYQLKTWWFKGHISQFVQGSVRDSLSFNGLSNMSFFIPEIEEQLVITEILQCADKEIDLLKAKLKQLKVQKKGLMQQLLTGKKRLKIN